MSSPGFIESPVGYHHSRATKQMGSHLQLHRLQRLFDSAACATSHAISINCGMVTVFRAGVPVAGLTISFGSKSGGTIVVAAPRVATA